MWLYIGLGLIAVLFYILKSFKYDYWDKRGVPTASGCRWFFGHYKPILLVKKHMNNFFDAMYKEFPEAPVVGYYMMGLPGLVVKDLDLIKMVLMTEFSIFNSNGLPISRHPKVQEKLRFEIKGIISKNNGELTIEDIENAKYLDMVYCETFRLFSFVSSKMCTQDCYLPMPGSDPLKITKDTPIIIPVYSIHKDPKYYPDPEKFDPERWTDQDQVASRPKYTFMPFEEGPRKCVGMLLATLQIKVAILKIIENFNLKLSPKTKYPIEIDPSAFVTTRPKDDTWVIFEQIK